MFVEGGRHTQYLKLSSLLLRYLGDNPVSYPVRPLYALLLQKTLFFFFLDQGDWMSDADSVLKSGRADEEEGRSRTEVEIPKGTGHSGLHS